MQRQKLGKGIKAVLFAIIAIVLLVVCNFIAQPTWTNEDYSLPHGIYEEPSNTIETLFLGGSHVFNGISPMELYEDYGICAYDLSTSGQPLMGSYYWLEEIYQLHSQTLDTVVLDASVLRRESSSAEYHKVLDPMRFSLIKMRGVKEYSENFEDFMQNMFPILSYHERWKELSKQDFSKYKKESNLFLRGYYYSSAQVVSSASDVSDLRMPLLIPDETEQDAALEDTQVQYFEKMLSFCEEHDIKLVMIALPTGWTSADHNVVQKLANAYGVDFLDFNIEPYYSEIEYNLAADSRDANASRSNIHANYSGAVKLTDYLGRYLIEECGNRDVRGEEQYAFMEEELAEYHQYISLRQSLLYATDPCDYIEAARSDGDCTVFISVKDDAATSLTEEQRTYFKSIGLTELSQLTYGSSYLAVIENGDVITEQVQKDPGAENASDDLISYSGILQDGTTYTLVSGGYHMGNTSSIMIGDTERSSNKRGFNIAIYDNQQQQYISNASFDTWAAPERETPFQEQTYQTLLEEGASPASLTGADRILYLYDRACENEKTTALARRESKDEDGFLTYLQAFWDDDEIDLYITAQGNASGALTEDLRTSLSDLGLMELSQLSPEDAYVAVVCGGEVKLEEREEKSEGLEVSAKEYAITSAGESGNRSTVTIQGKEYSEDLEGIYIVVYDQITERVVDTITFESAAESVEGEVAE